MLYEVCRLRIQYVLPGLCPGNKEPITGDSKKMINVSPLHRTFGGGSLHIQWLQMLKALLLRNN